MEEVRFGLEDLEVCKKARAFKIEVCNETKTFLPKKNFGMTTKGVRLLKADDRSIT